MCDRIGILNNGKLVALDSTNNLLKKIQTKKVKFSISKQVNTENNIFNSLKILSNDKNHLSVLYEKSKVDIKDLIKSIENQGINIIDISTDDGDLEDVFLTLTKN